MTAVTESDIVIYNSTNGLGGVITSEVINSGELHAVFDRVTAEQALTGLTDYHCVYIRNNATSTLFEALLALSANTPNTTSNFFIGLGTSVINGTEQVIPSAIYPPVNIVFTSEIGDAGVLTIGDLTGSSFKSIWLKRVIDVDATAISVDSATISIQGTTEG